MKTGDLVKPQGLFPYWPSSELFACKEPCEGLVEEGEGVRRNAIAAAEEEARARGCGVELSHEPGDTWVHFRAPPELSQATSSPSSHRPAPRLPL